MSEARYSRILRRIWDTHPEWTADDLYFAIYLFSNPSVNILGCYGFYAAAAAEKLKWSVKKVNRSIKFHSSGDDAMIAYDDRYHLVLVRTFLQHNPLQNPNQIKAAIKVTTELPPSPLLKSLSDSLPDAPYFNELKGVLLKKIGSTVPETVTQTVMSTVPETVTQTVMSTVPETVTQTPYTEYRIPNTETPIPPTHPAVVPPLPVIEGVAVEVLKISDPEPTVPEGAGTAGGGNRFYDFLRMFSEGRKFTTDELRAETLRLAGMNTPDEIPRAEVQRLMLSAVQILEA